MSTLRDLMSADFKESSKRFDRYWRASSLPIRERRHNKPRMKPFCRDRVMWKLIRLGLNRLANDIANGTDTE